MSRFLSNKKSSYLRIFTAFLLFGNAFANVLVKDSCGGYKSRLEQMFIIELNDREDLPSEEDIEALKNRNYGGVILFKWNISNIISPYGIRELIGRIQNTSSTQMFISVDQEGGWVQRLTPNLGYTDLPFPASLGEIYKNNSEEALRYAFGLGNIIGRELFLSGVNWNFAPVLDVNTNTENPIIGNLNRAFSQDPSATGLIGEQVFLGLNKWNIVSSAKHFPGHGDTQGDSHEELVYVDKTLDQLNETELIPFKKLISSGIPSVMIGHIILPKIPETKGEPATLSTFMINNVLRGKLNYKGIVVTDDLSMEGVAKDRKNGEIARDAILAGNNVLIARKNSQIEMIDYVCGVIKENKDENQGLISDLKSKIEISNDLILATKKKYNISKNNLIPYFLQPQFNLSSSETNFIEVLMQVFD